jgi:hypothetical protein
LGDLRSAVVRLEKLKAKAKEEGKEKGEVQVFSVGF